MFQIAYSPIYQHSLPEGHRFPMIKYELIPEQLIYEGTCTEDNFFAPKPIEEKWVLTTHSLQYYQDLINLTLDPKIVRKIGFPLTQKLVDRELVIVQGTIDCALIALKHKVALNVAGGTHHAYKDSGEGFCLLNDIAIASNYLLINQLAHKILIIDLDVHQGNGTAKIFEHENRVFTFSMHGKDNYPMFKEKSDLDIELITNMKDEEYLDILQSKLPEIITNFKPDFLFYLSGVDILETDKLGKLSLSIQGCKKRDEIVFNQAIINKLPIAVAMGGGYSPKIADIIDAHCNTFRLASNMFY